jgi:monofunctional biosynthetic peptidoglycan transglycosylase
MFKRFKNFRYFRRREKVLTLFLVIILTIIVVGFIVVPDTTVLQRQSVEVTRWYRNIGKKQSQVGPSTKTWTRYSRVSKHMYYAIVAAEDSRFYDHFGLDLVEIMKSLKLNLEEGQYVRGGSTITQQVVKMALLTRDKTLWRKMREAMGAIRLEMEMPKSRILEWYINLAEFGDGVYGIKDAAWHYFRTKPELITIQQAVNLALVLPSPNSWSAGLRRKNLTDFGKRRFAQIVRRMYRQGFITKTQMETAIKTGDFGNPVEDIDDGSSGDTEEIFSGEAL